MACMAHENDRPILPREPHRLQMYLGYQRAGRVNHMQAFRRSLLSNRRRNSVGAEDDSRAVGHLIEFIDKDHSLGNKGIDHVLVVDDFFSDVDRTVKELKRQVNDFDGALNPRTETTRLRKQQFTGCHLSYH